MRTFRCAACGQPANFEDSACESCGTALGYDASAADLLALEPGESAWIEVGPKARRFQLCANARHQACNWVTAHDAREPFCAACRHNHFVPDLSLSWNVKRWRQVETAKRRLIYSLLRLQLPLPSWQDDPAGLAFDFLADPAETQSPGHPVMTGHDNGLITINLAEADDAERERRRAIFGEHYRTLLGHFRHEIGHYFWTMLVRDTEAIDAFRALFGDERADYGVALQRYYASRQETGWRGLYVSAYATAHPWEDFAETWAHYLHIVDTLETASAFGLRVRSQSGPPWPREAVIDFDPYRMEDMGRLVSAWLPVTYAVNSLNRSMGQPDLYPFVLSPGVIGKLAFIHELILAASGRQSPRDPGPDTLRAVIAGLRTRIATPRRG